MADISYWGDEYKREVEQFRTLVNHLTSLRDSLNSRAINQAINDCDSKVNRLKEVKKSFGLELRLVKDKAVKTEYDNIMKDLDNNVATLTQEFKDMKTKHSKSELLQGSNSSNNPYSTEGKDNDSLLEGASLLQDKTAESLVRSKQLIETSKEVGSSTIDELKRQREQIKEIETQVDTIESSILRAERLVLNFGRRMATDKIIQGFAAINIVVMLGLILYVAISGKSLAKQARTSKYFEPFLGASPTPKPSRYPTVTPTYFPTAIPTVSPTLIPTYHPTITFAPSFIPSGHPTSVPSSPSSQPSSQPTSRPTERPSSNPISYPTSQPTNYPTSQPSSQPTTQPTVQPTVQPTSWPTSQPTGQPTNYPTFFPTSYPSGRPTSQPSVLPSSQPSAAPTTSSPTPLPT